jgi:hypothetical protein
MQERFIKSHPWVHALDAQSTAGLYRRMTAAQELAPSAVCYPAWSPEAGFQVGHFQVVSCSQPGVFYAVHLEHGCTCTDASTRAPFGWCKHRLAVWLYIQNMAEFGVNLPQKESAQATSKAA